jgi:hypothetical protein
MIELIEDLPDNVVGIVARGRVTNEECDSVLRPAVERSLKRHRKVRLYYEVASRFPGAGWEDLTLAIKNLPQWERIAVVSDTGWVRHTVNALRFLLASEVRVFTTMEAPEGRDWIASEDQDGDEVLDAAVIAHLRAPRRQQQQLQPHVALRQQPRSPRPSAPPARQGDQQYRRPSAGGRQSH